MFYEKQYSVLYSCNTERIECFTAHLFYILKAFLYVFLCEFLKMYFASTSQKTIERVDLNSGSRDVLVSDGLDSPEGLAIDWIHRRMYWTDKRSVVFAESKC